MAEYVDYKFTDEGQLAADPCASGSGEAPHHKRVWMRRGFRVAISRKETQIVYTKYGISDEFMSL
jgi:hypothetical protein